MGRERGGRVRREGMRIKMHGQMREAVESLARGPEDYPAKAVEQILVEEPAIKVLSCTQAKG